MTRLLSLANELVHEIDKKLDSLTRKNFRLTCKQINAVIMPELFSRLVIKINSQRLDLTISQLQALALGTSKAAEYACTVEILSLSPGMSPFPGGVDYIYSGGQKIVAEIPVASKIEWAHDNLREFLPLVLASARRVKTVIWDMQVLDPQWSQAIVSNFLFSLTNLEELAIRFPGIEYTDLGLHRLTSLRKLYISGYSNELAKETESLAGLVANSPALSHFDIDCIDSETSPALHNFLRKVNHEHPLKLHHLGARACYVELNAATLPHLRNLKSLRLELLNSPTLHIFDTLRKEKIYVNALATDILDRTVLEYMASYTGMEQISLLHISNDEFAPMFWDQVLPRHAETLVQLDIKPIYEGNWCFGELAAQSLVECKNLSTLSLALKREDLAQNKAETTDAIGSLTSPV
ncbi:hypothetical protein BD779DRAFT_1669459 [Infundibulicybe gibba]|nr:hypothetical protein BD779DRAFT_1669459 [Infundibulicybe gibba]